uniref:flavin-containing monooxygenase n=1 Tax=Rhodococcus qingshengii TaxID=334542 RepID=UPI0027E23D2D|nr:NAD(P)/FAD-dependent oxidoreductase [Rhodococcus qingshengii]
MANHSESTQKFDVLIIGAGISGTAAAVELTRSCPEKTFAILEMRNSIGGTWDLFRYPGIRSDSDMYTLGYSFKPWTDSKAIASGASILQYIGETIDEFDLENKVRLNTRLTAAAWDSSAEHWTLSVTTTEGQETLTCNFLYLGSGYYSYEAGFNPTLPGEDTFGGAVVHPQQWPESLDHTGKKVAVVGSGATAITLVPSLADTAAEVAMIQRSPTYLATEPNEDPEVDKLREEVGATEAFLRIRERNLTNQQVRFSQARLDPEAYKADLFDAIDAYVGIEYRKEHFTPTYAPWDQRVCFVPDGDLFESIRKGAARIVTGAIESLEPAGVRMVDGELVEADIVVKATGLNMAVAGDAAFTVDGVPVDFAQTYTYKGVAYSGVPNLFFAFGFLNSSWTLRIELVNKFWVRVMQRMDELGTRTVVPQLRPEDDGMGTEPFISGVNSGYFKRGLPLLPKQGHAPWVNPQSYEVTRNLLAEDPQDGVLTFTEAEVTVGYGEIQIGGRK